VKKRGELEFGANRSSSGTSLLLIARPSARLLRVLFAFEALERLVRVAAETTTTSGGGGGNERQSDEGRKQKTRTGRHDGALDI